MIGKEEAIWPTLGGLPCLAAREAEKNNAHFNVVALFPFAIFRVMPVPLAAKIDQKNAARENRIVTFPACIGGSRKYKVNGSG